MMMLDHLTVNTGHLAAVPETFLDPETYQQLLPLIEDGSGTLDALKGLHIHLSRPAPGGAIFSVHLDEGPAYEFMSPSGDLVPIQGWCVTSCGLAWRREAVEVVGELTVHATQQIRGILPESFNGKSIAVKLPWLMTLLYPHFFGLPLVTQGLLGTLESLMGLALIKYDGLQTQQGAAA